MRMVQIYDFEGVLFWCLIVIVYAVCGRRIIPLFLSLKEEQIRLWEEFTLLIYYFCTTLYVFTNFKTLPELLSLPIGIETGREDPEIIRMYNFLFVNISFYAGMFLVELLPPWKSDLWDTTAHHLATILLMTIALYEEYIEISVFVLTINGICDVFLESSKIAHKFDHILQIPLFLAFTCSHMFFRMYCYPSKVIDTAYNSNGWNKFSPYTCIPLGILNFWWLYRALRVCFTFLKEGETKNLDDRKRLVPRQHENHGSKQKEREKVKNN